MSALSAKLARLTALFALCLMWANAHAQGARQQVESLGISTRGDDQAKIRAQVSFALNDRLDEMVRSGRRLAFTFQVHIFLERPYWLDLEYEKLAWSAHLAYDSVLDSYQVVTFNGEEHTAADVAQAMAIIGDVHGLEVIAKDVGNLLKLSNAKIRTRFEVDVEKLPPPVRIEMLSLLDWDFSSGWWEWDAAELARAPQ